MYYKGHFHTKSTIEGNKVISANGSNSKLPFLGAIHPVVGLVTRPHHLFLQAILKYKKGNLEF
jgi:hypothetical protein